MTTSALILALLLLASPRWEVTVRDGDSVERYLAVTMPVRDGDRLAFYVEIPASGGKAKRRRQVSVPSARATVREVEREPEPFGSR